MHFDIVKALLTVYIYIYIVYIYFFLYYWQSRNMIAGSSSFNITTWNVQASVARKVFLGSWFYINKYLTKPIANGLVCLEQNAHLPGKYILVSFCGRRVFNICCYIYEQWIFTMDEVVICSQHWWILKYVKDNLSSK